MTLWRACCLFRRYPAQQVHLVARSISYTPSKSQYEVKMALKLLICIGVCTAEAQAVTVHKYPSTPKLAEKVSSASKNYSHIVKCCVSFHIFPGESWRLQRYTLPSKIRRNLEIFPIIINALAISCFACTSLKNVIIKAAPYLEEIQYYTPINLLLRTVQLRFMCTYTVTFRALLATPSILN